MAKVMFNPLLSGVRGSIGKLVTRQYRDQQVLSGTPDMAHVKWSGPQVSERKSMSASSCFYRELKVNPAGRAWLESRARELGIPKPAVARQEFARRRGEARAAGIEWAENYWPEVAEVLATLGTPAAPPRPTCPEFCSWCW
jgi:hypothetical protein